MKEFEPHEWTDELVLELLREGGTPPLFQVHEVIGISCFATFIKPDGTLLENRKYPTSLMNLCYPDHMKPFKKSV